MAFKYEDPFEERRVSAQADYQDKVNQFTFFYPFEEIPARIEKEKDNQVTVDYLTASYANYQEDFARLVTAISEHPYALMKLGFTWQKDDTAKWGFKIIKNARYKGTVDDLRRRLLLQRAEFLRRKDTNETLN